MKFRLSARSLNLDATGSMRSDFEHHPTVGDKAKVPQFALKEATGSLNQGFPIRQAIRSYLCSDSAIDEKPDR
jgi:hypothetical protein